MLFLGKLHHLVFCETTTTYSLWNCFNKTGSVISQHKIFILLFFRKRFYQKLLRSYFLENLYFFFTIFFCEPTTTTYSQCNCLKKHEKQFFNTKFPSFCFRKELFLGKLHHFFFLNKQCFWNIYTVRVWIQSINYKEKTREELRRKRERGESTLVFNGEFLQIALWEFTFCFIEASC